MKIHWPGAAAVLAAAVLMMLAGCDSQKKPESTTQTVTPKAQVETPAPQKPPATETKPEVALPLKGTVKEVLTGGGFTYLRVESAGKPLWIAVPETEVKVGEKVEVAEGDLMHDFPSSSLGRTFPRLLMATALVGKAPKPVSPHSMTPTTGKAGQSFESALKQEAASGQHEATTLSPDIPLGSSKAIVPFAELKVKKATGPNSYTVGDLFAKAKELNGKKVRVRGQVVKFSPNIMGRNWIHIQDGTGDPLNNSHDLVATSSATATKGEIVTITGTLHANKDFGAGYVYKVIIEDATIGK